MKEIQEYVDVLEYKHQIILSGPPGTGKTYTAKDIAESLIFEGEPSKDKEDQAERLEGSGRYALVQFHPAYTYEDFVRGIVVETDEKGQTKYSIKNKILGEMAKNARVFDDSPQDKGLDGAKQKFEMLFNNFLELKQTELNKHNNVLPITLKCNITKIDRENMWFAVKYPKQQAGAIFRIKFTYIKLAYLKSITEREPMEELLPFALDKHQLADKYLLLSKEFTRYVETSEGEIAIKDFKSKLAAFYNDEIQQDNITKNYVLIIDEINRANLPSVLGELIYALEYRGEEVKSMYAIKEGNHDDYNLMLPKNLYIIGTMNTADRSTGQIDYAIRRRFAFIDVLPDKDLIKKVNQGETQTKAIQLFTEVEKLFKTPTLSSEFKPEDVMLGHSYFLAKDITELRNKLDYEIKPLLKEYRKDGIFTEDADEKIKDLKV